MLLCKKKTKRKALLILLIEDDPKDVKSFKNIVNRVCFSRKIKPFYFVAYSQEEAENWVTFNDVCCYKSGISYFDLVVRDFNIANVSTAEAIAQTEELCDKVHRSATIVVSNHIPSEISEREDIPTFKKTRSGMEALERQVEDVIENTKIKSPEGGAIAEASAILFTLLDRLPRSLQILVIIILLIGASVLMLAVGWTILESAIN